MVCVLSIMNQIHLSVFDVIASNPELDLDDVEVCRQNSGNDILCPICIDTIVKGEQMVQTECGHKYHVMCALKWAYAQKEDEVSCPVCRENIFVKRPREDIVSQLRSRLNRIRTTVES